MSSLQNFYTETEDTIKEEESLNKYIDIFNECRKNPPSLDDALKHLFLNAGSSEAESNQLITDIKNKAKATIEREMNAKEIKLKYPYLTKEEALTISSYTCEAFIKKYSPYILLNSNMVSDNREEGLKNVSKYLYIFLKALRKLPKYYLETDPNYHFLYRCIRKKVPTCEDKLRPKLVPYITNNNKTFWAFTSTSHIINKIFLGKNPDNPQMNFGTIFTLVGKVWGYDIFLFNYYGEEEILLEPERKFTVEEVMTEVNDIIRVRCILKESPNIDLDKKEITIKYKCCLKIRLFGHVFYENNWKNISKIIVDNREVDFQEEFEVPRDYEKDILEVKINLLGVINMKGMFADCEQLVWFSDYSQWDTSQVIDMSGMFSCCKLDKFPDISKWNTLNVENMSEMFYQCKSLPDFSNWNTSNVKNMSYMFKDCSSKEIQDISKWDTSNVKDMSGMFCSPFIPSLPDISKWNTSNVENMKNMFGKYRGISLPDISKWDTSKVQNMCQMFFCIELTSLPDISKWNTSNVESMNGMFSHSNITSLPDISKWNTSNVESMNRMFSHSNITSLPDISKWDISKVKEKEFMFPDNLSLSSAIKNKFNY